MLLHYKKNNNMAFIDFFLITGNQIVRLKLITCIFDNMDNNIKVLVNSSIKLVCLIISL